MLNYFLIFLLCLAGGGMVGGGLAIAQGGSWWQTMTVAIFAVVVSAILLARVGPARRQMFVTHGLLLAGILSTIVSIFALMTWITTSSSTAKWVTFISATIAIICFIRYTCQWFNWCAMIGLWWRATAWPAIRVALARVFTWFRGPFLRGVGWAMRRLGSLLVFCLRHVLVILLVAVSAGLYYSLFHGFLWFSVWWWLLAFIIVLTANLLWYFQWWRTYTRLMLRRFGRWLLARYIANWNRMHGLWQGWFIVSGILLIPMIMINLFQERARPGTGMLTKFFGISASSYNSWGEITIPGILLIGGGLYLGWLGWQVFVSRAPQPPTPQQRAAARAVRRAARHAAGANP